MADEAPSMAAEPMGAGGTTPPECHDAEGQRERAGALLEHRRWLVGIDHESSVSFDKVLVTLAAGGLGISVSQTREGALSLWSLEFAWGCFTLSLLAILLSYLTARREVADQIAATDWKLQRGDFEARPEPARSWHEVKTTTLNRAALVCLVAGICFLVGYAARNLK